jgi:predicted ArsR family transcriptional regulator
MRELVQRQARALGDPTRYDIFRYVAEAGGPVRVATLAAHFGFNHNAIRQHLAKLTEALLFTEELAPASTSAGRPPLQYRLAPTAMGSWGAPGPYELLAVLLLRMAETAAGPAETGREAGLELAAAHGPGTDPLDVLEGEMASRGFQPRWESKGDVVELVLERCPFETAATLNPDIVCEMHRGLAEGLLEGMRSDKRVVQLVVYEPAQACCRLQLGPVEPAAEAVAAAEPRSGRDRLSLDGRRRGGGVRSAAAGSEHGEEHGRSQEGRRRP